VHSYMTSRVQCVKINNELSRWYETSSGVPQGGILSPLLFSLVMDKLKPFAENSCMIKFADDICLLHFIREENEDRLSDEFENIIAWSEKHGLCLNSSKTKLMNFRTKRNLVLNPLIDKVNNIEIETVHSTKHLGLTISDNMTWHNHVDFILSKVRRRVYILYNLREAGASPHLLWTVYCLLMRSITSYAYPAWCNHSKTNMKSLTAFESRVCKLFHLPRTTNFDEFCEGISHRLAMKALHQDHPLNFIYDREAVRHSTRRNTAHRKVMARTCRFKNSFIRFA